MWRKNSEAKPQPAASQTPAPAPVESPERAAQPASTPAITVTMPTAAPAIGQAKTALTGEAPAPLVASVPAAAAPPPAPSSGGSTISAGLKIKGEITGTSDLTIDGETQGKVRIATGRVTVGPNGRVTADIDAPEIVILGTVRGSLRATEKVRLGASSQVEGSVLTPRILIEDGALLRGTVEMVRPGQTPEGPKTQPPEVHPSAAKLEPARKAHAVAGAVVTSSGASTATDE
ncbi:MAG TPA: polymer-forming cytoskeletal protein [Candidatus Cybelea sp.]|nr:polymer-forming cytoskeletal protein [Candidatus Cybelea sp.]